MYSSLAFTYPFLVRIGCSSLTLTWFPEEVVIFKTSFTPEYHTFKTSLKSVSPFWSTDFMYQGPLPPSLPPLLTLLYKACRVHSLLPLRPFGDRVVTFTFWSPATHSERA